MWYVSVCVGSVKRLGECAKRAVSSRGREGETALTRSLTEETVNSKPIKSSLASSLGC